MAKKVPRWQAWRAYPTKFFHPKLPRTPLEPINSMSADLMILSIVRRGRRVRVQAYPTLALLECPISQNILSPCKLWPVVPKNPASEQWSTSRMSSFAYDYSKRRMLKKRKFKSIPCPTNVGNGQGKALRVIFKALFPTGTTGSFKPGDLRSLAPLLSFFVKDFCGKKVRTVTLTACDRTHAPDHLLPL